MTASSKLDRIRRRLIEDELDAIMVSSPENRRYMSGFTGSAGYLLISQDDAVLATDFRYIEQAGQQSPDFRISRTAAGLGWLPEWTAEQGVKRIGFESEDLTVHTFDAFKKAAAEDEKSNKPELVGTTGIVEKLRVVKDENEIKMLTRAVEIAEMIASNAPLSIEGTKAVAHQWRQADIDQSYRMGQWVNRVVLNSEDAKEGPLAFAEKREAEWQGR